MPGAAASGVASETEPDRLLPVQRSVKLGLIQSLHSNLISSCMPDPNHIHNPGFSINPVGYLPGLEDQLAPPGILLLKQNGPCLRVASQYLGPIINTKSDLPSHVRPIPQSYESDDCAQILNRTLRPNQLEVHDSSFFLTSSFGTTRPA
jgi:hypothetical protein